MSSSSILFGRDCFQSELFVLSGLCPSQVESVAAGLAVLGCSVVSSGSALGCGSVLFQAPRQVVYWLAGRFGPLGFPLRFSDGAVQGRFCSLR